MSTDMSTMELAVLAALERLADENARSADLARKCNEKADATFFQRAANSYVKALQFYRAGLRPDVLAPGRWLLPSQRPGEPPHLLHTDGDIRCTCPSADQIHWASALIIGIEVAHDILEAEGVGDGEPDEGGDDGEGEVLSIQYDDIPYPDEIGNPDAPTPAQLGSRLAQARRRQEASWYAAA